MASKRRDMHASQTSVSFLSNLLKILGKKEKKKLAGRTNNPHYTYLQIASLHTSCTATYTYSGSTSFKINTLNIPRLPIRSVVEELDEYDLNPFLPYPQNDYVARSWFVCTVARWVHLQVCSIYIRLHRCCESCFMVLAFLTL